MLTARSFLYLANNLSPAAHRSQQFPTSVYPLLAVLAVGLYGIISIYLVCQYPII